AAQVDLGDGRGRAGRGPPRRPRGAAARAGPRRVGAGCRTAGGALTGRRPDR
ncbi:MAG: hypothetical protein AVDCRST_MAG66-2327, partial [uncultured Pseudonocardia sp.]